MARKYGWVRDTPDHRDIPFVVSEERAVLPPVWDMTAAQPPVYDQGNEGSCVGNGCSGRFDFQRKLQGLPFMTPSRQFVYYNARRIEGTTKSDSGAQIRDGIKALAKYGVCPETEWPYLSTNMTKKPTAKVYKDALKNIVVQYQSVAQDLNTMKACLAGNSPIVIGFSVYESFESDEVAKTGIAPLPGKNEQLLGGHCVEIVGFSDPKQVWICRNSWGTSWGNKGYFTLPYSYLTNPKLSGDFWTLVKVNAV